MNIPRGFIVVPSEDDPGKYIPFLVLVRDEDIIWKKDKVMEEQIAAFVDGDTAAITPVNPKTSYRIERGGWFCEIQSDGLTRLTTRLPVDSGFEFEDENHISLINAHIRLPISITNESYNAQVTINSNDDELKVASVNTMDVGLSSHQQTVNGVTKTFRTYDEIGIQLSSPIYRFPDDYETKFREGTLHIAIQGYIPVF